MRTSILFAVAAAAGASAQIRLPFSRQSYPRQPSTQKRTVTAELFSADSRYVVNATVGTPPQHVSFQLTLSSDQSWVPDAQYCNTDSYYSYYSKYEGCIGGSYNHNVSSTYVNGDEDDDTFYVYDLSDRYAYGKTMNETIGFAGGQNVSNLNLGRASEADTWGGVMALGYNGTYSYNPNILDRMLALGFINSTSYSLWVDQEDAETGHVLFGAIDTSAIDGTLKRFSVDRSHYDESSYSWSYTNTFSASIVGLNSSSSSDGSFAPVISNTSALPLVTLDPTSSLSVVPEEVAHAIWDLTGAHYDELLDIAIIPCSSRDTLTEELAIQLSSLDEGPVFNVPLSDLVMADNSLSDIIDYYYYYSTDEETDYSDYCLFGVQMTNDSSYTYSRYEDNWVLGGGMLKRQYMVFDLANEDVAMAPIKFGGSDGSDSSDTVIAFSMYGAKIPESTGEDSKCYADDEECNGSSSGSGRSGSSSSSSSSDSDGWNEQSDYIGLIVGFSILGAVMLGIAIWGIVKCCRDNNRHGTDALAADKETASPETAPAAASPATQQVAHNTTAPAV
ncbi:hypothetical protein PFICI_11162 [Pestalotiopsis fici W106-1]|uniref:Peptidase A1 domain-containing protein n=1 Tax=Pestalotiopsis fici (strain W106-1 / CGMCC3.15140) TaxID=1229662 RepID=W3WTU4_PESFW|nr:uncharacterized protein PFICI_11162 [Pestalotiopsis fici W106-1]ETS77288.1 hypothetical protein PFICI_11162 [Pestalotiopsis fici W106-1]